MTNVDLFELFKQGIVKTGAHNVNVPIKKASGENYSGKTYMIPLEYLYYNDQNGRIGVALSEYESVNGRLTPGHNEEYNMIIQQMLTDGGDEKTKKDMKTLKKDIYTKGQQEVGYVLIDGRVIDGNRRFTAKRLLEQDPSIVEQQYFEAVILGDLSVQNHNDQKKIKALELQIQFGKLDKVDYNPIDRAIDAYKTIVISNIMSAKEYSEYANLTPVEVNKRILEAELVVKFLEFANADTENYALAKQMDLDGPLQDLIPQYKKFKNDDNAEQLLNTLFAKIVQIRNTKEDYKQEFRQIVKNVIGTRKEKEFLEEMEDATDAIVDALDQKELIKSNIELVSILHNDKNAAAALADVQHLSNHYSEISKNQKEHTKPLKLIEKALNSLESIDRNIILSLPKEEKIKFDATLTRIQSSINAIRSVEN